MFRTGLRAGRKEFAAPPPHPRFCRGPGLGLLKPQKFQNYNWKNKTARAITGCGLVGGLQSAGPPLRRYQKTIATTAAAGLIKNSPK